MNPVYNSYVNENFSALLPKAKSDLFWKETAYKVSQWSLWLLAGTAIFGLVITSVVFPHIILPEVALSIAPALALVFALNETRNTWTSEVIAPRHKAFIEAQNKFNELNPLSQKEEQLNTLTQEQLKDKVASFGLNPNSSFISPSLIARYEFYAEEGQKAQDEAIELFSNPANEKNYYNGYRKEEMAALANKVHAAAMLHLMKHPEDTRSLKEMAPITPQRFDERARLNGSPFAGHYLPGVSREFIRFGSIRDIASRLFGT